MASSPRMPRPRLVRWEELRDALQAERPDQNPEATTELARRMAREINRGDNRMRYRDHQFHVCECCLGLNVDRQVRIRQRHRKTLA